MAELGETDDPKQLVPGEPGEIRKSLAHLVVYGDTMLKIGDGLKKLDTGGWTGKAADAYHERFSAEPGRWITAGEAFHSAARAIEGYAGSLEWAQGEAARAIELYRQGEQTTRQAKAEHDQALSTAAQQAAAAGQPPPPVSPFTDLGEVTRAQARDMLACARTQLVTAGDQAVAAVDTAQEHAPQEPTFLDEIGDAFTTAADWTGDRLADGVHSVAASVRKGMDGVGELADDIVESATGLAGDVADAVGKSTGQLLHGLGMDEAADTVASSMHQAAQDVTHAGQVAGHAVENSVHDAGTTAAGWVDDLAEDISGQEEAPKGRQYVIVDQGDYPEAANHVREAQMGTSWRGDVPYPRMQPMEVTIDREEADERREESMKQVPQTRSGYDRDEYPPAMFSEGGEGSSVKYIDPFDNRGAGSSMRHQVSSLDDGEKVIILAD
ncbi:putative T7SS-secreted protein [Amycolatopsis rhizosphaerae]|nr:NucA/NucB deoxyribonuclease domain-containing protein [Amycolatopsis rhizosphaerae]